MSAPSSASDNGCSTYTAARESSALFTSNDGFSVVAPMKVMRPCSTKGRKASCCALLKRWTSSTKRMVWRPECWRSSCARSSAWRMSFTPEKTAESAMNCASNASAMSRASVVFPTPGGPHRIIEWGLRASNASLSGLPGPKRWLCPTTSSSVRGRSRSASGAAGSRLPKRSFTDDVGAFGRAELEALRRDLRVPLEVAELDDRRLPELVVELHRFETAFAHPQADALERGVLRARRRFEPVEPAF